MSHNYVAFVPHNYVAFMPCTELVRGQNPNRQNPNWIKPEPIRCPDFIDVYMHAWCMYTYTQSCLIPPTLFCWTKQLSFISKLFWFILLLNETL